MKKPTVYISSSLEGLNAANALSLHLQNEAIVKLWFEGVIPSNQFILESIEAEASQTDFAIFVLTPDEFRATRGVEKLFANYFIELGYFMGKIGRSRTFIVAPDSPLNLPIDLHGVLIARYKTGPGIDTIDALAPASNVIKDAIRKLQAREERPPEFYSCFISYSSSNNAFAEKLYGDLQQVGVRCWLDAKELRAGEPWREQIERAIQAHEKVLLVLSHDSIQSRWVRNEIEDVLRLEQVRGKTILFPIRLDDSVFDAHNHSSFELIREKQIGDFKDWQNPKSYRRAFSRLLRDLMISTSVETKEAV